MWLWVILVVLISAQFFIKLKLNNDEISLFEGIGVIIVLSLVALVLTFIITEVYLRVKPGTNTVSYTPIMKIDDKYYAMEYGKSYVINLVPANLDNRNIRYTIKRKDTVIEYSDSNKDIPRLEVIHSIKSFNENEAWFFINDKKIIDKTLAYKLVLPEGTILEE